MRMWEDSGPASQGKILTAILQGRPDDALKMLRGWSDPDLVSLEIAATKLSRMAGRAARDRARGFQ